MEKIMGYVHEMQNRLRTHSFFEKINNSSLEDKNILNIAPIMSIFVMNFRDMNRWVIRFNKENNEFEKVINGSTLEDETHSKLFLEDWRKLHLDDALNWTGGDALWWLFLSQDTESFRRYGVEFMRLCVDDKSDSLVRFAHSEAGEACGHVFFENVTPIAERLTKKTGLRYRYFGLHHLELETGHVLESEGVFENQKLNQTQSELGLKLAGRMFDIFDGIHNSFEFYLDKFLMKNLVPKREKNKPIKLSEINNNLIKIEENGIHKSVQPILDKISVRKKDVSQHPLYLWLVNSSLPHSHKLKRFIPLWIVDVMGYRDLNKYVFKYHNADNDDKSMLNSMVSDLELHSQLFLDDWDQLDMDYLLRWTASDCMDFLFFDSMMDTHRKTLIDFGMIGLGMTDPKERFWFILALEASGEAFFKNTREVAIKAEEEENIVLNYLADRHHAIHIDDHSQDKARKHFYNLPIEASQCENLMRIVDFIFDSLINNLDLSYKAAIENKFSVR